MKLPKYLARPSTSVSALTASWQDPGWGRWYGETSYTTPEGTVVRMYRKGQRVRFFDAQGRQVGPEHGNVAPAIVAAYHYGWENNNARLRALATYARSRGEKDPINTVSLPKGHKRIR